MIVVSSVVPKKDALIRRAAGKIRVVFVSAKCELGVGVDYPEPESIGADRLANAAAVAALYGTPAVVVDFGTAVTFDVVSAERCYIGGVIAPGLEAMTTYLYNRTALLPKLSLAEPRRAVGRSTKAAMMSGAIFGYRGLVKEILAKVGAEAFGKAPGADRRDRRLREIDRGAAAGDRRGPPAPDAGRPAHHREFESLGENEPERDWDRELSSRSGAGRRGTPQLQETRSIARPDCNWEVPLRPTADRDDREVAMSLGRPNDDAPVQQLLAVELEVAGEMRAADEEREPMPIVGPHLVVGDGVERRPERDGFVGFVRFAFEIVRPENGAMQAVAVAELEMQFAMLDRAERFDPEFLESFAQGGLRAAFRPDRPCRPGPLILPAPKPRFLRMRRIFSSRTMKRRLARTRGSQVAQLVMSLNVLYLVSGEGTWA